jgi:L-glyceraldehyde 3-phosphate reductase
MHLDYVDIFYHHRPDPDTPIEETMGALDQIVRSGKALYVGISNYNAEQTRVAVQTLRQMGTPMLIHQPKYSMMVRTPEQGLAQVLKEEGLGCIAFSPLNNGILTNKYLTGIPYDSRAARDPRYLKPETITNEKVQNVRMLNEIAVRRGQSMAQLALQWVLRDPVVTSALIGASRPEQVEENVCALRYPALSPEDLGEIEAILSGDAQI